MKTLPLTKGKVALVDDADFEWLSKHKWYATKTYPSGIERWYAARKLGHRGKTIYMHRSIIERSGIYPPFIIDHKDSNGLNNKRDNIRLCSPTQNNGNMRKRAGCSSKYKGIGWNKKWKRWRARITFNRNEFHLGHFENDIDAAKAYDSAAKKLFGEFALINFPKL